MSSGTNARPDVTTADAVIGVSGLLALTLDAALLVLLLVGAWSSPPVDIAQLAALSLYLLTALFLGSGVGAGIALMRFDAGRRITSPRLPLVMALLRVGLVLMPTLIILLGGGAGSMAFVSFYLVPTTLLLLLVSGLNIFWRRSMPESVKLHVQCSDLNAAAIGRR